MTQPPLQVYHQANQGYAHPQYQYPNTQIPVGDHPTQPSYKANPWGLSPLSFGLLVATLTAIVVGGAVGGGVAGAMSGKDSRSPSPTRIHQRKANAFK